MISLLSLVLAVTSIIISVVTVLDRQYDVIDQTPLRNWSPGGVAALVVVGSSCISLLIVAVIARFVL